MGELYEMDIKISNYKSEKEEEIKKALSESWEGTIDVLIISPMTIMPFKSEKRIIQLFGQSFLQGGECEEEFYFRVCDEIWKTNEAYCDIEIEATCLEEIPSNQYKSNSTMYNNLDTCRQRYHLETKYKD
jgi:hypothetical protein